VNCATPGCGKHGGAQRRLYRLKPEPLSGDGAWLAQFVGFGPLTWMCISNANLDRRINHTKRKGEDKGDDGAAQTANVESRVGITIDCPLHGSGTSGFPRIRLLP